jgi:hypothetical protein
VLDNGVGISEENIEKVFALGWSGGNEQSAFASYGLGLASVRATINSLPNHSLVVKSRVGVGTRFSIYLPVAEAERLRRFGYLFLVQSLIKIPPKEVLCQNVLLSLICPWLVGIIIC